MAGPGKPFDLNGDGKPDGWTVDADGDGQPDMVDTNGDGIPDSLAIDLNGDGIPDASGPDLDGDGVPDGVYVDMSGDGLPDSGDWNGDGSPDGVAVDMDGDGQEDVVGVDTNGDGVVDATAVDENGDGVPDTEDTNGDNIPDEVPLNTDGDPAPDEVGHDDNEDGLIDVDQVNAANPDPDDKPGADQTKKPQADVVINGTMPVASANGDITQTPFDAITEDSVGTWVPRAVQGGTVVRRSITVKQITDPQGGAGAWAGQVKIEAIGGRVKLFTEDGNAFNPSEPINNSKLPITLLVQGYVASSKMRDTGVKATPIVGGGQVLMQVQTAWRLLWCGWTRR